MCFLTTTFPNAPATPSPILFDQSVTSNFIDDEEFFVLSDLFEGKNTYFLYEDCST